MCALAEQMNMMMMMMKHAGEFSRVDFITRVSFSSRVSASVLAGV